MLSNNFFRFVIVIESPTGNYLEAIMASMPHGIPLKRKKSLPVKQTTYVI